MASAGSLAPKTALPARADNWSELQESKERSRAAGRAHAAELLSADALPATMTFAPASAACICSDAFTCAAVR